MDLQPGQPCTHPGCASHLSHPCESCGRYAAGLANGPNVVKGQEYIRELARNDNIISTVVKMSDELGWTWDQALTALVIWQRKAKRATLKNLADSMEKFVRQEPVEIDR